MTYISGGVRYGRDTTTQEGCRIGYQGRVTLVVGLPDRKAGNGGTKGSGIGQQKDSALRSLVRHGQGYRQADSVCSAFNEEVKKEGLRLPACLSGMSV
jgi:hypothetical protein